MPSSRCYTSTPMQSREIILSYQLSKKKKKFLKASHGRNVGVEREKGHSLTTLIAETNALMARNLPLCQCQNIVLRVLRTINTFYYRFK